MVYDFIIVGGGIVGLSTAYKLNLKYPEKKIIVLEKEDEVAKHQTGNNSGVIHSGVYYKPGSYKARNCVSGRLQLIEFCDEFNIPYEICGKVIVAVSEGEIPRLEKLHQRAEANGLKDAKIIDRGELKEIEPYAEGIKGLQIPETGIIDFGKVCLKIAELLNERGVKLAFNSEVKKIITGELENNVFTKNGNIESKYLINCGGLHADRIAEAGGVKLEVRIVPFRGEYYELSENAKDMVKSLIYPVPDPQFPFLGVHFTRMIDGKVECGPNAVLAFKREGYSRFSFNLLDTLDSLSFAGFRKLTLKHWRMGIGEFYRSYSKSAFLKSLQRMMPGLKVDDITPGGSGVRANALDRAGNVLDDFYILKEKSRIHVISAPSPAATACLSLGDEILRIAEDNFRLKE